MCRSIEWEGLNKRIFFKPNRIITKQKNRPTYWIQTQNIINSFAVY